MRKTDKATMKRVDTEKVRVVGELCMEKREGWSWYLRLALVSGFFPPWHSRDWTA